jgi:hypothetical protein
MLGYRAAAMTKQNPAEGVPQLLGHGGRHLPARVVSPGGAAAILHRPDPIIIVVVPSFVVELAYVKLPF